MDGTLPLPASAVQITEVVITQFKTHTIDIEYRVKTSNPNSFPLILSPAEYTFSVRGTVWDKGALPQGLQIPPKAVKAYLKP
ncbi:MAG: hypothetical protein U5P10_13725 [Spirochaetia bacterium]|nr:hypothetical protein [Spirochaetia bacterium]